MRPSFTEMKDEALRKLEGKWGLSVVVVLLVGVISAAAGLIPFGSLLIGGPLTLGMAGHFLRVARSEAVDLNLVFDGFKQFGNALGGLSADDPDRGTGFCAADHSRHYGGHGLIANLQHHAR